MRLNFNPKWLGLVLSIVLGLVGASTPAAPTYVDYLIGLLNGCLIYCTAVGINTIGAEPDESTLVSKGAGGANEGGEKRNFRSRWF